MSAQAAVAMTNRLTLPYRRGAEWFRVPLGVDAGGKTLVPAYAFLEYQARYGEPPAAPTYVVVPQQPILRDDCTLTFEYAYKGANSTTSVTLASGAAAHVGVAVPLPAGADGTLRITTLAASPVVIAGPGAGAWELYALLGNIAKLAWIAGREKDILRGQLDDVRAQRLVDRAHGAGLDALGADLLVPRFPPRPHSFDANTVGLWHLDDIVADGGAVLDDAVFFGRPGHPGVNTKAVAGALGRYATGFGFPGPSGNGAVVVAPHADFDVGAGADFTIEAFVKADVPADAIPRAIVAKRSAEQVAASTNTGWSLCIVNARGFNANVQFAICDGTTELKLFADLTVSDGRFHHVAGAIDRARGRARLFVDGVQRAVAPLGTLGAIASADALRFGSTAAAGNALAGVVDEVRFSNVSRTTFHPALGEDDDAYRARLRIFRRWLLPTPGALLAAINEAVRIDGHPDSFVLIEKNKPSATVVEHVRLVPNKLPNGQSIDALGVLGGDGTAAVGLAAHEPDFNVEFLLTHADARVTYTTAAASHMQAGTAAALNALLARITALGIGTQLVLDAAYDATKASVQAVGRALLMHHLDVALPPDVLGALAHRAGFDFVRNDGLTVFAAVARGERVAVKTTPDEATLDAGGALDLEIAPAGLSLGGQCSWTLLAPGSGAAHFIAQPTDPPTLKTPVTQRRRVRLVTDAPGEIVVRVEFKHLGHTQSGTRRFTITTPALTDGENLDAFGNFAATEAGTVGTPEPDFDPMFLLIHPAVPQIDFSASPATQVMQVGLRDALDDLVAALVARGTPGRIVVTTGLLAGDPILHGVGRAIEFHHETLDAGVLSALAAQYFDYVRRQGTTVYAAVRRGSHVAIVDAASGASLTGELVVGTPIKLAVAPGTLPNTGTYNFSTRTIGNGRGTFDFVQRPSPTFTPTRPGEILLAMTYVQHDDAAAAPYTFGIALNPLLDPKTIIPKHQYDIIMNILNAFHPIGIEVTTDQIRAHVVEIEKDPSKAFPAYSFPDFRR